MILLIDNYDSFTYNLVQEISKQTNEKILVLKNDEVTPEDLNRADLHALILSPGPGRPEDAGNMNVVLKQAIGKISILGVCLGHQAIGEVYGGKVIVAPTIKHGEQDQINQNHHSQLFKNCPEKFTVARYHSLVIDANTKIEGLSFDAIGSDGSVQAVSDNHNQVYGVEFHPGSIMTDQIVAKSIFQNFVNQFKN